jgi:multidrug efflux pump
MFFVVVRKLFKGSERQRQIYAEHARQAGVAEAAGGQDHA